MKTKSSSVKTKSTKNSFFSKIARARSVKGLTALQENLKVGCSNPKTVRRRRRALEAKLEKLAS
jgi:hypothetical protein